jgi:putative ABC transport system permease protein
MNSLFQDLGYALRQLRRSPGFTAVAVATLALGIGANTAIFSIFNATLLRPLPYKEPDRLVLLWSTIPRWGFSGPGSLTDPDYVQWAQQNQAFEQIAAFRGQTSNLTGSGMPERLLGSSATATLFPLLGAVPELGRAFSEQEQRPGHEDVVLLSHRLWARRFGSDPGILGKAITLDGKSLTVVGVWPSGFQFPNEADFWTPMVLSSDRSNAMDQVIARLKPDVTIERADQDIQQIAHRLSPDSSIQPSLAFLKDKAVANSRHPLTVLLVAVGLVLLIACANVANLLLSKATERQREIVMRRVLGASRMRIVRQMLTESVLLAGIGGALGLLLAVVARNVLAQLMPQSVVQPGVINRTVAVNMDAWVLGFSLLISLVTGILFGLAPALQVSKAEPHSSLKGTGTTHTSGVRWRRMRSILIVGEFALTLVLLVGAGLLLKSFVHLLNVDPGFAAKNVAVLNLELPETRYHTYVQMLAFHNAVLDRIGALPGVHAVGTVGYGMPFGDGGIQGDFTVQGQAEPPQGITASKLVVSPNYFRALGIPLKAGRVFDQRDTAASEPVVMVSQSLARHFWPGQPAVGQKINPGFPGTNWCSVVGVAGDVKQAGLANDAPLAIYMPYSQGPSFLLSSMAIAVRTNGDPQSMVNAVRTQVQSVDPEIPVFGASSMEELIAKSVSEPRFNSILLGSFAVLALVLAAVGIYGVIAYSVSQRTHEIGIRMALGAGPHTMTSLVVGEGAILTMAGIGLGVVASLILTRLIANLLFGVTPTDPAIFCGVLMLLTLVALAGCYIPARRASRIDPMVALRYE